LFSVGIYISTPAIRFTLIKFLKKPNKKHGNIFLRAKVFKKAVSFEDYEEELVEWKGEFKI
jgi:hypothetical protein